MIGTTLGHYEVKDQLGKGGMGEVYRARDTKLGREVAIKVLPAEFSQDEERLSRLEREARMLASLNHPNIAAIYGLEQSGDTRFLVLELVEGDTLAERLKRGGVPVRESLELALQIAEALEAAHERGVIHRDLKPANVKVTPAGKVKVLDFGLAKAFVGDQVDMGLSNSPTLSLQATQQGVILGTAAYMAPEQARGDAVDHRADVWAFGCVLFEMVTGQQTWSGRTVTDIIGGIVAREPDWDQLPSTLHVRMRFLLERCLEKEPKDRCQGIAEARAEIQKALQEPEGTVSGLTAVPAQTAVQSKLPWAAAILLALAAALAVWFLMSTPVTEPGIVARFRQELAAGQNFRNTGRDVVAVSPDGTNLAYNTSAGLYLRTMDEVEPRLIPGTEGAISNPFFSPDGEWIGYFDFTASELRKIRPTGGASVLLTAATNPNGAYWAADDTIIFGQTDGIVRVSGDGGNTELIVPASDGEQLWDPQVLPTGAVIFTAWLNSGEGMISVQAPGSVERVELVPGERAMYVPTGHLIATDPDASPNTLLARAFDPATLELGGPVPMEEGIAIAAAKTHYAVSPAGTLAYVVGDSGPTGARPQRTLIWVDREGRETPLAIGPGDYTMARVSPDGTKAALVSGQSVPVSDPAPDIWILDLGTGTLRQLTFDPGVDDIPVWNASSDLIYFRSFQDGGPAIYSLPADGGDGVAELVGQDPDFGFPSPWSVSPDGQTLGLNYGASIEDINLATLSLDGNGTFTDLLSGAGIETEPVISPHGEWLAYQIAGASAAENEINVRPFPGVTPQRIPLGPGSHPVFSTDGSELFYFDGEGVSVKTVGYEPGFFTGPAESLFRGAYWYGASAPDGFGGRAWDPDPSGERFLMISMPGVTDEEGGEVSRPQMNIVLDWFDELRARVPVP